MMKIENCNLKILFMGTPYFAATALQGLVDAGFYIVGVVTQPDKKVGRGGKTQAPETKIAAIKNKLSVFQPENNEELVRIAHKLHPDLIVVAAYGRKIPKEVLEIPKYKSLNLHGSLLPEYRGSSCIPQAILDGKPETGVTIMQMAEEIDAGAVITRVNTPIDAETTTSLTKKLAEIGTEELVRIIPLWIEGELKPNEQDHESATFCKLIKKEDALIDWNQPAEKIERMVRAYIPWPNAYTFLDGKMIKILQASVVEKSLSSGQITFENKKIYVGTGKDSLDVIRLKPENSKEMSASDFINGNQTVNGKFFD